MSTSAAVIGAGISGLLAARTLAAEGLRVQLYEKARGPGGRMSTRRQEGHVFDHGAQYFTVREEHFRSVVEALIEDGVVARWDPRLVEASGGRMRRHESRHPRFVGTPRMSSITRYLARGLDVVAGARISAIARDGPAWKLETERGPKGPYDIVLVTTPPEQAVPLLAVAPALARVASSVYSAPCLAVMATFATPLSAGFDGAFVDDARLAWAARNDSKPGRPSEEAWVLHGTAAWSAAHAKDDAEEVVDSLVGAFFESTGIPPTAPRFGARHRWMLAQAPAPLDAGALWDAELGLGVCGDWLNGCRVEGAALSGLELARRVLDSRG